MRNPPIGGNEENMLGSVCSACPELVEGGSSVVKVENSYDGFGRRRIKKVFQLITDNWSLITEIHLIYDGPYIIAETDGSGNLLRHYVRNGDQLLAVEDVALGKTFYYFTDGNKNVTDLIDSDGVLAAHYEYDPFGKIVVKSGYYADTNPFRFSSEYFDKETSLVAYLYRFYSPEYCRFLDRDPIGIRGGINPYTMVNNNPINFIDLFGLTIKKCCVNGKEVEYDDTKQCCENNKIVDKVLLYFLKRHFLPSGHADVVHPNSVMQGFFRDDKLHEYNPNNPKNRDTFFPKKRPQYISFKEAKKEDTQTTMVTIKVCPETAKKFKKELD